ncbi:DUF881 domain-containing protein [Fodinicola feengrottensis]|uniref:DUF881 domain-containing protein n=1 Tax=Fodinicola feengrottensis TaxID=435914 RepID=UPI0024410FE4|nr:DUF881 domain-containing protein [Fodinicola feengrottensis]
MPVVMIGGGMLFAASAETANGTDLRSGRQLQLQQLINSRNATVTSQEATARELRRQIQQSTATRAHTDGRIAAAQSQSGGLEQPAGLTALAGPGLTVSLNDAPHTADGQLPPGATVNDVVVHQQDVQAVVNALWAGGAEAVSVMGQRLISTGAVRCVGNVLLLYGRTYSPPFVISAIGPPESMRAALNSAPAVLAFTQAARDFGLGYRVTSQTDLKVPGYIGQVSLPLTGGTK